jgi:hypothetical protein
LDFSRVDALPSTKTKSSEEVEGFGFFSSTYCDLQMKPDLMGSVLWEFVLNGRTDMMEVLVYEGASCWFYGIFWIVL